MCNSMSRRSLVKSLASTTTAAGCLACSTAGLAGDQTPIVHHCCQLNDPVEGSAYANGLLANTQIIDSTGLDQLDFYIKQEGLKLSRAFEVSVDLLLINDPVTPNAFAINRSHTGFSDGTIMLGRNLSIKELVKGRAGLFSLTGIMAHEWAHIVQYEIGHQHSVKERELHADYMSGWYLANQMNAGVQVDLSAYSQTLYARGDYEFNEMHHGTPAERVSSMMAGVTDVRNGSIFSVSTAFDAGLRRVRQSYYS